MGRHRERHQLAVGRGRGVAAAVLLVLCAALSLAALWAGGRRETSRELEEVVEGSLDALGEDEASEVALNLLDGARQTRRESELSLVEEGEKVLEGFRLRGDCIVAQAGYLDLSGKTWACVIQGAGWVELCVIREGDGGGSEVTSWRMDVDDVEL